MPFKEVSKMHLRKQMVIRVIGGELSVSGAAHEYGVSRNTVRMWVKRAQEDSLLELSERSRRPSHIPRSTPHEIEAELLNLKAKRPTWGAKKLVHKLWPADSPICLRTADRILKRSGQVKTRGVPLPIQRFEKEEPNDLWQIDFKGLGKRPPGYSPLTMLDDASRFCLALDPLKNHLSVTIMDSLWEVFGVYGLPKEILMDNEPCFRDVSNIGPSWLESQLWLLGIKTTHGAPYHPQTQGKVERFHRTIQEDLGPALRQLSIEDARQTFNAYIHDYNYERPHEAIDMNVPGLVYVPSPRPRPRQIPEHQIPDGAPVYKLATRGMFVRKSVRYRAGRALAGQTIYLQEQQEGLCVFFAGHLIAPLKDLRA
jgi:transposase InsO family protein